MRFDPGWALFIAKLASTCPSIAASFALSFAIASIFV
jgi:hypothetical protein